MAADAHTRNGSAGNLSDIRSLEGAIVQHTRQKHRQVSWVAVHPVAEHHNDGIPRIPSGLTVARIRITNGGGVDPPDRMPWWLTTRGAVVAGNPVREQLGGRCGFGEQLMRKRFDVLVLMTAPARPPCLRCSSVATPRATLPQR